MEMEDERFDQAANTVLERHAELLKKLAQEDPAPPAREAEPALQRAADSDL